MEYCQGFLLQNMVALLTYDDSVKRLLFAKKIPNHDVLSGLLTTLQQRIKTRRTVSQQQQQQQQQQNVMSPNIVKPTPINAAKTSHSNATTNGHNNNNNNNINNSSNGLNKSSNNLMTE